MRKKILFVNTFSWILLYLIVILGSDESNIIKIGPFVLELSGVKSEFVIYIYR